ncbi:MAG: FliH/SctL family protein [Pseudomonadota bacterium]
MPELLSATDIRAMLRRGAADFFADTPAKGGATLPPLPSQDFKPLSFDRVGEGEDIKHSEGFTPVVGDAAGTEPEFHPTPAPEKIDLEALKAAAREEGRAEALKEFEAEKQKSAEEARAAASAEAEARFADMSETFMALIDGLTIAGQEAEAVLAERIEAAVLSLASDRAGREIDAVPEAFLARIEGLCRDLTTATDVPAITLNPDDLEAVLPHLKRACALEAANFQGDEALSRGDLRLALGDVFCSDILKDPDY